MANYRYFWDLQNSQAYTNHTVQQFDANSNTGGGDFRWVSVLDNTNIINIPGVRIKPTSNLKGYWERSIDGPWLVDWFGCNNSASQLILGAGGIGLTNQQINDRFNCVTKDVNGNNATGSNTIVGSDTYDTAAMKVAFNLMELGYTSSVQFLSKDYYISNTCNLPRNYYSTADRASNPFVLLGNGAQIRVHSTKNTTAFTFWTRIINSQTDADTQVTSRFVIDDFNFRGYITGGLSVYQNALKLSATTNSKLTNLSFSNLTTGLTCMYCVNAVISNLEYNQVSNGLGLLTGLSSILGDTPWSGATFTNSQSKNCNVDNFKFFTSVLNVLSVRGIILEYAENANITNYTADIAVSSTSIGTAINVGYLKKFKADTLSLNVGSTSGLSYAFGIVITNTGINNAHLQLNNIANLGPCILISYSASTTGLNNNITVRNITEINAGSIFADTISDGRWLFENCRSVDPTDANRWFSGIAPTVGAWTANGPAGSNVRLMEAYPFYVK